jgi:RES domain-containing protein
MRAEERDSIDSEIKDAIDKRLSQLGPVGTRKVSATVYRFINPKHAKPDDIVSGKGGFKASGRWHLKGNIPVTYTSLDPETALSETLGNARYYNLPLNTDLPRMLVSLSVDLSRVLDLTNGKLRQRLRLSAKSITQTDWRADNRHRKESLTQVWGRSIAALEYEGILAPSSTAPQSGNLIVFPQNLSSKSTFKVTKSVVDNI